MSLNDFHENLKKLENQDGFFIGELSHNDLSLFRKIVEDHFRRILKNSGIKDKNKLNNPIYKYHEISNLIDHSNLWAKKNRIISKLDYKKLLESDLLKSIKNSLSYLYITNEDNHDYPEIYFRLVRPTPHKDIGPLHADKWFWDISDNSISDGFQRIKFWFSLWNCNKISGFRYVPGSHKCNYIYDTKITNNVPKPSFNEELYDLDIHQLKCDAGGYIVFNDSLLHGGFVTNENTRISIEFTLLIKQNDYYKMGT